MSYTKITNFATKDSTNDIIKGTEFDNEFNSIEASFTAQPSATQVLTNKTVNLTSNTLTGTTAQFNTALSDGDFATLAGSETLTNKALNGTLGATTPSTVVATTIETTSTIKGATTISVGAATPSSSGAGITFPATQSASTDANTLDDYEEGTWTPNQGAGLTVVGAFSSTGTYTKTGRLVTVSGTINGATSVAITANTALTSNLPFVGANYSFGNSSNAVFSVSVGIGGGPASTIYMTGAITATPQILFSFTYSV